MKSERGDNLGPLFLVSTVPIYLFGRTWATDIFRRNTNIISNLRRSFNMSSRKIRNATDYISAATRLYNCDGSLGVGTACNGVLMYVTSPGFSDMSISSGFAPSAGVQLKWCNRWPNIEVTKLIPSWAPGHTRLPAPNGSSLKSCPFMSTSSSRNLSGRNSFGAFQTAGSRATAQTFT